MKSKRIKNSAKVGGNLPLFIFIKKTRYYFSGILLLFLFFPIFRSKFSDFIIFPAIDFQFNTDLLNFYVGGKSNYMVYLETKNDIIQFSPSAIKRLNYLNLFQKRYQEKC